MCLLLGATGVGKTLFMKRLEHIASAISKYGNDYSFVDVPATISTKILSERPADWILMRRRVTRRLIWIQSVCIGNHKVASRVLKVGTNLVTVNINRKQDVTVREIGGCMGPIWKNYFKDCSALMYMVDISNRLQVAAACIQLLSVLSNNSLTSVPVLIIFNKIDMPEKMSQSEIDSLFRLSEITSQYRPSIQCAEISACTGKGIGEVIRWLEQVYQGK